MQTRANIDRILNKLDKVMLSTSEKEPEEKDDPI